MKIYKLLVLCVLVFGCCEEKEECTCIACDKPVIVDSYLHQEAPDDYLMITKVSIEEDCLVIEFSSSGCDGSTWKVNLIDSEAIAESYPPQRTLRLSLHNEELCDAVFKKEVSFDITPLRVGGDQVILNLQGWDEKLTYSY
ncbi:hypothetical protein E9993_04710 [Labilibacter sediminis]|nr:hypothetical protein E9993_04710 [Labilibacter sediminis]